MKLDKLIQFLENKEGKHYTSYRKKKDVFIGVGHNVDRYGLPRSLCLNYIRNGCLQEVEVDKLLVSDLLVAQKGARLLYGEDFYESLSVFRQWILMILVFYMGYTKLKDITVFNALVKKRAYEKAGKMLLLSQWGLRNKEFAKELSDIFISNKWIGEE